MRFSFAGDGIFGGFKGITAFVLTKSKECAIITVSKGTCVLPIAESAEVYAMNSTQNNPIYRYELHVHTLECDLAAHASGAELVRLYHDAGYSGMVVTDHYFATFYEWFAEELKGKTHREIMERRMRGYYAARNEGEKLGVTVLPGAEVRFDHSPYGINDFLIFGCNEEFFLTAPRLNELTSLDELNALLPESACVVLAHPFRVGMTVIDPSSLFGIEAHNGLTESYRNTMAEDYARHFQKPMTAGSDCHHATHACKGGIETPRLVRTPEDLTRVLRSGDYTLYRGS